MTAVPNKEEPTDLWPHRCPRPASPPRRAAPHPHRTVPNRFVFASPRLALPSSPVAASRPPLPVRSFARTYAPPRIPTCARAPARARAPASARLPLPHVARRDAGRARSRPAFYTGRAAFSSARRRRIIAPSLLSSHPSFLPPSSSFLFAPPRDIASTLRSLRVSCPAQVLGVFCHSFRFTYHSIAAKSLRLRSAPPACERAARLRPRHPSADAQSPAHRVCGRAPTA